MKNIVRLLACCFVIVASAGMESYAKFGGVKTKPKTVKKLKPPLTLAEQQQQCINNCGRWSVSDNWCFYDLPGVVKQGNQCVCDTTQHYVQATRQPTTIDNGMPRCVKPIEGIRLKVQTATFTDSGTDGPQVFMLCPSDPLPRPYTYPNSAWGLPHGDYANSFPDCFKVKFDNEGLLALNEGVFETIDLSGNPEEIGFQIIGNMFTQLTYPDDVQFFGFFADVDDGEWGGEQDYPGNDCPDGFDGWLLAGIELQIKLEGESDYKTLYRNPVNNRSIDIGTYWEAYGGCEASYDFGANLFSPHYIANDVAMAFYVEIADEEDADTDDRIFIRVPQVAPLSNEARDYFNWKQAVRDIAYARSSHEATYLMTPIGSGVVDIALQWQNYEDFPRNGKTSYGITIPNYNPTGYDGFGLGHRFKILTNGDDAVKIKRVKVYMFYPGSKDFIQNQKCYFADVEPNVWLSTDGNEGVSVWPGPYGYQELQETTCPDFNTIQWGNGQSGAYGFGRR